MTESKMSREEMKAEAIRRMKSIDLLPDTIKAYKEKGIVYYSERGILYYMTDTQKPEWAEKIKKAEEEYGITVYHAIFSRMEFGDILACLYVTPHEDEWEEDRDDLTYGYPLAYGINLSDPTCSEFGTIGIKPCFGGLLRTA